MRVFRNKEAAEKEGFYVSPDDTAWKEGTQERAIVRTDLECTLAEALEAVEWSADYVGERAHGEGGICPTCRAQEIPTSKRGKVGVHRPDCKLSLALKAFRGETTTGDKP